MNNIEIRNRFNKPAGEVISYYANLTDEDRIKTLDFQAKLVAICLDESNLENNQKTNLYSLRSVEDADKIILEKNISSKTLNQAKEIAYSQNGVPRDVPVYGNLLSTLGYIKNDVKDILMGLQAAERTRLTAEEKPDSFMFKIIKDGLLNGDISNRNFRREYADTGKPSTIIAQSINHLAEIFYASSELSDFKNKDAGVEILKNLATYLYKENYKSLQNLPNEIKSSMKDSLYSDVFSVVENFENENRNKKFNLKSLLNELKQITKDNLDQVISDEDKKRDVTQLLELRTNCIEIAEKSLKQKPL